MAMLRVGALMSLTAKILAMAQKWIYVRCSVA
jgi:hypothetical protein